MPILKVQTTENDTQYLYNEKVIALILVNITWYWDNKGKKTNLLCKIWRKIHKVYQVSLKI